MIAVILFTVLFVRDCSNTSKLNELTYRINATQFRPNLKLIGKPAFDIYIEGDKFAMKDLLVQDSAGILDVTARLRVNAHFRVANIGNSVAHVFGFLSTDTLSGGETLREQLTIDQRSGYELDTTTQYYKLLDISPNDTISVENEYKIKFLKDHTFTLHFLLLYENETGALFDTYYWARCNFGDILMSPQFSLMAGKPYVRFLIPKKQLTEFLHIVDDHSSTRMYSQKQAENIIQFLSNL